jgi:hypothetical protein
MRLVHQQSISRIARKSAFYFTHKAPKREAFSRQQLALASLERFASGSMRGLPL